MWTIMKYEKKITYKLLYSKHLDLNPLSWFSEEDAHFHVEDRLLNGITFTC